MKPMLLIDGRAIALTVVSLLVPLYGVIANIAFTFHARFGKRIRVNVTLSPE